MENEMPTGGFKDVRFGERLPDEQAEKVMRDLNKQLAENRKHTVYRAYRSPTPEGFEPAYSPEICRALAEYPRHTIGAEDKVQWVEWSVHDPVFTLDGRRSFNLFHDFPWALTDEELEAFVKDQPYWADFFGDRIQPPNSEDRASRPWVGGRGASRDTYISILQPLETGLSDDLRPRATTSSDVGTPRSNIPIIQCGSDDTVYVPHTPQHRAMHCRRIRHHAV